MTALRGPVARSAPAVRVPAVPAAPSAGLRAGPVRVGLHLVLAGLPLLSISAHVFGLVPMHLSAALLVVPLVLVAVLLSVFAPAGEDRVVLAGAAWGVVATVAYDVVRFDTVYLLGWWGDFIPTMGGWVLGHEGAAPGSGDAVVGYLWRYLGDGGGIGIVFFVLAAATGLWRCGPRVVVGAAVVFAVVPVWAGLIGTVALAPGGQQQMFPLTPTTVALSLLGHLVFGVVLGLGAVRAVAVARHWPWAPLVDLPVLLGVRRSGDPRLAVIDPFGDLALAHTVAHTWSDRPRPGPSSVRSFEGRVVEPDRRRRVAVRTVGPVDRQPGDGWGPWTGEHPDADADASWAEPRTGRPHGDLPVRSCEPSASARARRRREWDPEPSGWPTEPGRPPAPSAARPETTTGPRAWSLAASGPSEGTPERRSGDHPPPDVDERAPGHRPPDPWDDPAGAASWRPRTAAPPPRPELWTARP